ncbi:TPA: deoxynucleoside kinase [Enterobacter cloacae]|nr:deoxynucleoside kinase [Enterobacter cloacae]HBM7666246.1 deoxynucleoside kinase [Enterobacter cloacae subsp. cloacae]MCK6805906.1 deoxynucleoside kinase [Enterobacter cloacae]MCK6829095.1 deoxynucleoside kinase [Enterobacter cloacae]MCM7172793.1 deoxynucleoside kinase [Enterobacter cloacae]MDT0535321.1 deoxynucleoside kinase [Enterobacter cloacae]
MRYNFLYMDPWSADKQVYNKDRCPLYICLSGNSGVGKSTLLKKLSTHLFKQDSYTIAVDEKSVHHSLLPYLFNDTKNYGYLIQINFMIQRALIIKSWLDKGYNLIMERSHIEDYIFINFMFKAGYINRTQHDSYIQLWERISELLAEPDIIAFIDYPVEYSLAHLKNDEMHGIRPEEFPDEEMKIKWITGWHAEYQNYIENLPDHLRQRVLVCNRPDDIEVFSDMIIQKAIFLRR